MIVRVVRLSLNRKDLAAFDALFHRHHADIESQFGCRGVELLTDPTDPSIRGTLSRWESEDALNAYRRSELFGVVWPATKALFSAPPEVWSYEVAERGQGLSLAFDS
ncbi:MAG: putative quinol monooxygenase [Flavobacteriales bacterium]